ncbi:MAG: hypothetical protein ACLPSO_00345 [Terracidiphilus sp.]
MPRTRGWIVSGLLLAAPIFIALTYLASAALAQNAAPPVHKRHKTHKPPPPLVLPPLPAGPLSQLPMDQIPATPANVSYQDGLLTISAQNSTLGEILRDVRKLTGASFEFPAHSSGADERVVVSLGPGAPREVLAAFLNGSPFNYVMLGSNSDPTALATVILTPKASVPGGTQTTANGVPGAMPPNRFPGSPVFNQQNFAQQPGNAEADDSKDEDTAEDTAEEQPQPAANVPNPPQPPDPNQPTGPRTPEQILEMLQRQRPQPPTAVPPPPQQ